MIVLKDQNDVNVTHRIEKPVIKAATKTVRLMFSILLEATPLKNNCEAVVIDTFRPNSIFAISNLRFN